METTINHKGIQELIAREIRENIHAQYNPIGNVHDSMLQHKYISVSYLIKMTAVQLVDEIRKDSQERTNGFYSYRGNTLADEALKRFVYREVPLRSGDINGWSIRGHADAISLSTFQGITYVSVIEHKTHEEASPHNIDMARRQGILYLSLVLDTIKRENGIHDFGLAKWQEEKDPNTPRLVINTELEYYPGVVSVPIVEWGYAAVRDDKGVSLEECSRWLDFYTQKTLAIATAIETGDMKTAEWWDMEGPGVVEFARDVEDMFAPPTQDVADAIEKYHAVCETLKTYEHLEDEKSRLAAEILNALQSTGQQRVKNKNGLGVTIIRRKNPDTIDKEAMKRDGILLEYSKPGNTIQYIKKTGAQKNVDA